MNTESIIGKNIRNQRELRGMTRERLAEAINIDTGYLGMCERGERQLGLKKTIELINYFGITPNDIIPSEAGSDPQAVDSLISDINASLTDMNENQLVTAKRIIEIIACG
jgi:transcriptional regulator with XRE-family HTH domain